MFLSSASMAKLLIQEKNGDWCGGLDPNCPIGLVWAGLRQHNHEHKLRPLWFPGFPPKRPKTVTKPSEIRPKFRLGPFFFFLWLLKLRVSFIPLIFQIAFFLTPF